MRIDLHSHSTASDGTDPPAEVVRHAGDARLDVVALTDHDTVAGHVAAAAALPRGIALVPGAELSCAVDGASLHLLAYLFDPDEPLLAGERFRLRTGRERRARATVERLVALGAELTWGDVLQVAGDAPVGRPHIARAMVAAGVVPDAASAFTPRWIGTGGRAYIPKYSLDPVRAVALVRGAGGVAVLAHPFAGVQGRSHPVATIRTLARAGLAGLEVDHPEHGPEARRRLRRLADELGVVATGASDDHGTLTGHRLGCETTREEAYRRLIAQATGASVIYR
ncbi:MAG: PHP domain-containing protein [Streptosporangiaceae bacterium]